MPRVVILLTYFVANLLLKVREKPRSPLFKNCYEKMKLMLYAYHTLGGNQGRREGFYDGGCKKIMPSPKINTYD